MQIKYPETAIAPWAFWLDPWVLTYLRWRYGESWRWYWLNWQINREMLW